MGRPGIVRLAVSTELYRHGAAKIGRSKEDGSLHETEFLASRTRNGEQVYLLLQIWKREPEPASAVAFAELFEPDFWSGMAIGGERGYGWGRIGKATLTDAAGHMFDLWDIDDELRLTPRSLASWALSHVVPGAAPWSGHVEPLVGRETQGHRAGMVLSRAEITYKPGSRLTADGCSFVIGRFGIWSEAGG